MKQIPKAKENRQEAANREVELSSLSLFRGKFEGTVLMKRTGRVLNAKVTNTLIPSPSDKNKMVLLSSVSIWENSGDALIFNVDISYASVEKSDGGLSMAVQGVSNGYAGGPITSNAQQTITKTGITIDTPLFTITAKRH